MQIASTILKRLKLDKIRALATLLYCINKKKFGEEKNPWRSHFCIRGENLPEDDDEPVDFTYMDVIACALIKRLFCTVIILEE